MEVRRSETSAGCLTAEAHEQAQTEEGTGTCYSGGPCPCPWQPGNRSWRKRCSVRAGTLEDKINAAFVPYIWGRAGGFRYSQLRDSKGVAGTRSSIQEGLSSRLQEAVAIPHLTTTK